MENFSKIYVRGLKHSPFFDEQCQPSGLGENFALKGAQYPFNYIASRWTNLNIQLDAEWSAEGTRVPYSCELVFDFDSINGITSFKEIRFEFPSFSNLKVIKIRIAPIGSPTDSILFKDFYRVNIPEDYNNVPLDIDGRFVFMSNIQNILKRNFTDFDFIYEGRNDQGQPSDKILVKGKNIGSNWNLTIVDNPPWMEKQNEVLSVDRYQDGLLRSYYSLLNNNIPDFNVLLDVKVRSRTLYDRNWSDADFIPEQNYTPITTLSIGFNSNGSYNFYLKELLNGAIGKSHLPNFTDFYDGWLELPTELNIEVFTGTGLIRVPEGLKLDFLVLDTKWDNLSEEYITDYLDVNYIERNDITFSEENVFLNDVKFRIYIDFTKRTYDDVGSQTIEWTDEFDYYTYTLTSSNQNLDNEVDFSSNNLSDIFSNLENHWVPYFISRLQITDPDIVYSFTNGRWNDKFGWFEMNLKSNASNLLKFILVTEPETIKIHWVELQIGTPKPTNILPYIATALSENSTAFYTIKTLNNYRWEDSNYFKEQYDYDWNSYLPNGIKCNEMEVVDVYYNVEKGYCSSAFISVMAFKRLIQNDEFPGGFENTNDVYLAPSRLIVDWNNGSTSFISEMSYFTDTKIISWVQLQSNKEAEVVYAENPGIYHRNFSNFILQYITHPNLVDEWGNDITAQSMRLNFDIVSPTIGELGFSNPFKFNLIPVRRNEVVNEFVYRSKLGGFSSLNIVGQPIEIIDGDVERYDRDFIFTNQTEYWNGVYQVIQSNGELNGNFKNIETAKRTNRTIYSIEFRTTDDREYKRLRDLVESESIYYRIYDNRNPVNFYFTEIFPTFKYEFNANEYILNIEWSFIGDETLNWDRYNRI